MKKTLLLALIFTLLAGSSISQHTFSIVAVDSLTGEIGSAGATCGDTITWPGSLGAMIISDIIPGTGAIHTQAYYNETNQENAHEQMAAGNSPEEIIDWLVANDAQGAPSFRQYGVVDYNEGSPRSAGWTGNSCDDYKNHVLGPNYAIQGNILLGQQVLDSMETRFNETEGPLHVKLMAAMQGAKMIGADTRCTSEGTSSLSSFLRVAQPEDSPDNFWMELWVGATDDGVDPIDELQQMYDEFFATSIISDKEAMSLSIYPNPAQGTIVHLVYEKSTPDYITVSNLQGITLKTIRVHGLKNHLQINIENLNPGLYQVSSFKNKQLQNVQKLIIQSAD